MIALLATCLLTLATASDEAAPPIIVVGDIHGDYDAYIAVLSEAGLIDRRLRWSGEKAILVQLGDVPDRGPDTRKVLDHLRKLERQARRAGGQVVPLLGNHEVMNIVGDLRYVTPDEYGAFVTSRSDAAQERLFRANAASYSDALREADPDLTDAEIRIRFDQSYPPGYVEHRRAWSLDGDYGEWVGSHDTAQIIEGSLFVHGGMSLAYAELGIETINDAVREALSTGDAYEEILEGPQSPLWYRGNVEGTAESEAEVDAVLDLLAVDRIVVGHTPTLSGVRRLFGGKVIMVDTGMAEYYGGTRSFLRLDQGTVTAVDNGVETNLSVSGELQ